MDMLNNATLFAQIVSLLADYASQKSGSETLSIADFAEWTATHGHAEIMGAIERNQAMTIGVKAALAEGRNELLEKLGELDAKLSAVATGSGPLGTIAQAVYPTAALSEQSRALLCFIEEMQADCAIDVSDFSGVSLLVGDKNFPITEPRFFEDDIAQMVALGLLSCRTTNIGRDFRPTRLGARVGQELLAQRQR
ncbi:MAG TPA: hypothetical protein VN153_07580 [Tahibacter sp.]|nr:hypothetical protein [Tahibacter sp.]